MSWYTSYTPEEAVYLAKVLACYVVAFIAAMGVMWVAGKKREGG
jgi:hypothetical protein